MYTDRVQLYNRIEALREHPLIVLVTSSRPNAAGQIATDLIPQVIRQILAVPKEANGIDMLVVSNGGDPMAAWQIVSLIRERCQKFAVLLPYAAFSAATLLAMGADEIIMHPFANLGPVDPQITSRRQKGGQDPTEQRFGSEDLVHFLSFVREDVGITNQVELEKAFELLCNDVGALPVGSAKRSSQLMLSLGEKLLGLHMKDVNETRTIAESLNKSFYHHGYPVGRTEAKKIGLPIVETSPELEDLLWAVWADMQDEMKCDTPFNPLEVVFGDPQLANLLAPVSQIQLPSNLPPQVLQQAYQSVLQQIKVVPVPPVEHDMFQASIESVRCRSEFHSQIRVSAVRLPDMNISVNITPISQKWTFLTA